MPGPMPVKELRNEPAKAQPDSLIQLYSFKSWSPLLNMYPFSFLSKYSLPAKRIAITVIMIEMMIISDSVSQLSISHIPRPKADSSPLPGPLVIEVKSMMANMPKFKANLLH